ncbi:uncharacterized protein TNIN_428293 [Trichonephila inaurata madagascariensis]|uniref:AF4/FMR2 family member lilli n=1 Tax=Trichonephila inaurata madagascariensis TaxID=2747483 RepID=A0A8X7CHW1_9ARAC|nr:uncharacterized protein TNIN_428293 [Trichonephila inaurata madagascariensis]
MLKCEEKKQSYIVDVLREREQERRARLQLLDDIREPSPTPIFGEPVKVDREDETSIRIKNTLGDFTQVLVNDPKNLIGISRSNSSSHLMNGHPSNGYQSSGHSVNGYSMSSGGYSATSHQNSGYSSNFHSGGGHGSSGVAAMGHSSYNRPPIVKKPPPYIVNGGGIQKPTMPNYISPKAPDKRPSYNRLDKSGHYKPDSPAAAPVAKPYHSTSTQQVPYYGQDNRPKDPASWDKDQRRTNGTATNPTNPSQPVAVSINVNLDSSTNLTINNINVSNTTSAPIWNCGPDTPAVQVAPFHLPSNATPSNPKIAAGYGQTSTSYSNPLATKHENQNNTPAKRNTLRPSSLKLQPEREMTKVIPSAPLTAIQTPRTEETGFAFPTDPKDEETSFLKLEESVHLLTPLGDDPMPNDVRQSTPNSWWTSPDVKPSISQAECKVTDSVTYELSKQWKIASISPKKITPSLETLFVTPPEPVKPLEPAQKPPGIEANKYVSSSLQDDLEMSDSDDEVVPQVKSNPEQYTKSPAIENNSAPNETSVLNTSNNTAMDTNSTDSSNSSSDSSGDSDSDDSSSESNDSDSSSEASDEEISSKKWGLSNFVDESQRIHSPAFFQNDPAAKELFRAQGERLQVFNLNSVNPLNGTPVTQDNLPSTAIAVSTFLVPEVPVTSKNNLLSPIPSPVHTAVGPRTPPSPSCPPKQNFSEATDEVDPPNSQTENKSSEENDSIVQNSSPLLDEPQVNSDVNEEKSDFQNEKCKKQLRSNITKVDEVSSELDSSHNDVCVDETSDSKELSDKSLENDKLATESEKEITGSVSPNVSESPPENYSIKTRQRGSAASTAKKLKANTDNSSENNQKPDVGIAKLKHPRACRKLNEKQTKKTASTIASLKSDSDESKKQTKTDLKEGPCASEKKEPVKIIGKAKAIPKARAQNKALKSSPRQATEAKKTEVKKKKKKFSMENFLQSPETDNARLSNTLPPFSPSPERSPIPDCPNTSSEVIEESPVSPVVPCKTPGRPSGKGAVKGKKVEKLRRSVRCSERASNNAQAEASASSQTNSENIKNTKNVGKAKRLVENLSLPIEPPVELLSPIPQDPPPTTTATTKITDSAIPRKIMICIPLAKLSRVPVPVEQDQDSALRQSVKSTPIVDDARVQKKDAADKPNVNVTPKGSLSKDLNEKTKTVTSVKNKNNNKNTPLNKKAKVIKPPNEIPAKASTVSEANKNGKGKDKLPGDATESKFPKKRKGEAGEKQTVKKPKLSSRAAEERKKEASALLKSDGASNQLENCGKNKGLERCDSTGSLSSLCSQQSQRSSKSSQEKKDCSAGIPESKRIKSSSSPVLSIKDIKQEKEDKSTKNRCNLEARLQLDKNKIKSRDKATLKDIMDSVQNPDDCSSLCCDDLCKDDGKGKVVGSKNLDIDDFEHLHEIHKELKGGSNKHSNQSLIMPMDYYWTEGKKQIQLAERENDPFQQAVKYFEAVVLFILTSQQREEYSKDIDAAYQFYSVTLNLTGKLLTKIKKLQSCPGSTEFKLLILCLKSQSLLNVKHYNLKIKDVKEELDTARDFFKLHCSTSMNHNSSQATSQSRLTSLSNVPSPHSPIPSPASTVTSQNSNGTVNVPQGMLDMICRQHFHLMNLHKGHDLWEQADMYMTRSNLREFFKEVADQSEALTLHSSITELVKYIQKGISLVKKSLR